MFFCDFRNTAFATGDHDAIAAIGQFLTKDPGGPWQSSGMSRNAIFMQLKREFEFDVEAAVDSEELERKRVGGRTDGSRGNTVRVRFGGRRLGLGRLH